MSKKIIYTNGLIDLAQPRLGSKIIFKTDDFLHLLTELLIHQLLHLKRGYLIKMVNGWMDGSREEEELLVMII